MTHAPSLVFGSWDEVFAAPRSEFFHGTTRDWVEHPRNPGALLPSAEPNFTQSNARVLLGQAANGSLRFVALPTAIYPAPTAASEFGLGPGMYHHFDVAMYLGDLSYRLELEGSPETIDLAASTRENVTVYSDGYLPLTQTAQDGLEISLFSLAPVAADADQAALSPAPLPGPAGAIYGLHLRNITNQPIRGKVILQAGDLLIGHYEDARPELRPLKQPRVDVRQRTLLLSRPEGCVGVHFHDGTWRTFSAPFEAERAFILDSGAEGVLETHIALGQSYSAVMETIFHMHLHAALDWINYTASFWREHLGSLRVGSGDGLDESARFSREIYLRSIFDNFNCLQVDAQGSLVAHWQGAPSHGYGTLWGIDVEPTAVSIVHACPELARQVLYYFMTRSRAPRGAPDHSIPILVAPVVIARQWLQVSGDVAFLEAHPEVMQALEDIMQHLLRLEAKTACLFPTRYSSDGIVGRRYDYGTNVKVWYVFDSMAELWRQLGKEEPAAFYEHKAQAIQADIARTMLANGPFGRQISGGTNLDEDPGSTYLPEDALYYDGEDTSSMLAPVYGICDYADPAWINYHRYSRSLWHAGYDPEFDTLHWQPSEPAVFDGTAYFSRLAGSVTPAEMSEALETIRAIAVDDVTGSIFWWPHGLENKRALTRCSQGQGAWAWQYLQQWLGLSVDAPNRILTLAPRGLLTEVNWPDFRSGANCFGIAWTENDLESMAVIQNKNSFPWTVRLGFRCQRGSALGEVTWQTHVIDPGQALTLTAAPAVTGDAGMPRAVMSALENKSFGDPQGVTFKRFGPAMLWGHWEQDLLFDWDAMPLTLRFLIRNHSGREWVSARVKLECSDGWQAQGRPELHWPPPDHLIGGAVTVDIGSIADSGQKVAAYWLKAPFEFEIINRWEDIQAPFHAPSQPGDGLKVFARGLDVPRETCLTACLNAISADGQRLERRVNVPITILPRS
jgi:hypothetical protein